jgi:multidrug efflux pump
LTTPVVYVLLDKVRRRPANEKYLSREATDPLLVPDPSPAPSPSGKGLG